MISPTAAIVTLWEAWAAGWCLAAGWSARTVSRPSGPSRLLHIALMAAAAVLLFPRHDRSRLLGHPLFPPSAWAAWLGLILVVLGLSFTIWARVHLGRYWSGTIGLKAEHALIRSGPYALARHPIYTGLLVAALGTAVAQDTLGAALGLVLFAFAVVLRIRSEEQLLTQHFGSAYQAYQGEVRRLIPYVW